MIYIHVPFCRSFCTYCDFYSEIAGDCSMNSYADRLIEEIRQRRDEISNEVNTLYIGGGTPSVLPLSVLSRIVAELPPGPYDEFTVEVNPEDIHEKGIDYVHGLIDLGVNRISMGVQSFDDGILRWMNRRHDSARAEEAYGTLRRAGIGNISIDLIFGMSQLTDSVWEETLRRALALSPEHISAYQLSIEDGSALARMAADGRYVEAGDTQCRRHYDILCRVLGAAGYRHYEISNFAVAGAEAAHNSAYWRRVPYVGFGPGAHSFDGARRRWNDSSLTSGKFEFETLTPRDAEVETIMLALRTSDGIPASYLHAHADPSALSAALAKGLLVSSGTHIRIPEHHFFISDSIIASLI